MNSVAQECNCRQRSCSQNRAAANVCRGAFGSIFRFLSVLTIWMITAIGLSLLASPVQADFIIEPITWDVVGLDHNRPETSGPQYFPVGVRVRNTGASSVTNVEVSMDWATGSDATYIKNRDGSLTTLSFDEIPVGQYVDAYFEIQLTRTSDAFTKSREYTITATETGNPSNTASTPAGRQIYVEGLVSQNRNTTTSIRYGQDKNNLQLLGGGATLALAVGETYFIELVTQTSTAYEEIQSFLTLSNTIFQVLAVETTYGDQTAPVSRVPDPNPSLWGDGCLWDSDPDSPNYNSCLSSGKVGGVVTTLYQIKIISGGGDSVGLEALIYDRSGGSFHYNTDFSQSPGDLVTYDPTDSFLSKRFIPDTIGPPTANARLSFTITNPNPVELSGYSFYDLLPSGVEVASPSNASSTCGGTVTTGTDGGTGRDYIDFSGGAIGAIGSCMVMVDVTADTAGTYTNTSNNLFIGTTDTGNSATADLEVSATAPPVLVCDENATLALWTFPSGSSSTAPVPSSGSQTLTATAAVGSGIATPSIYGKTYTSDGTESWMASPLTENATLATAVANNEYFEFTIDTTGLDSIGLSFAGFQRQTAGATNFQVYYGTAGQNSAGASGNLALTKQNQWFYLSPITLSTHLNPSGNTVFRIYVYGASGNQANNRDAVIDDVLFTGLYCSEQPPPAPTGELPPIIEKTFSPDPIGVGHESTLTFTITNPNATALSGIQFRDELPFGVAVVPETFDKGTCLATSVWNTNPDNSNELVHSGGTLAAHSSCTLSVDVTSSTVGLSTNISSLIYATESGYNNDLDDGMAQDNLQVLASPIIAKDFDPDLVLLGVTPDDVSTLTFTITNPNPDDGISGVAFTDSLPAGLDVADTPNATTSGCGTPTWSPAADDTSLSFSGGSIVAGGTCTCTVDVTGPAGVYENESSAVSHTVNGVSATNGDTASASLVVDQPIPGISIRKQVGLNNSYDPIEEEYPGPWYTSMVVTPGTTIYYLFIVENTGEVPLSNVKVEDPPGPTPPAVEVCSWVDPLPVASAANDDHIVYCIVSSTAAEGGPFVNVAKATGEYSSTDYTDQSEAQYSGVNPTAVTMGNVELVSINVSNFLGGINVPALDTAGLLNLLRAWDPDAAEGLEGARRDPLLAALSAYLDPDGDGQIVVLRWETLEERGTVGFYAERWQGDDWVKINAEMLPGLIAAPMGAQYWLADPGARPGDGYQYRLIEVEARGTTREYGPFDLRVGK